MPSFKLISQCILLLHFKSYIFSKITGISYSYNVFVIELIPAHSIIRNPVIYFIYPAGKLTTIKFVKVSYSFNIAAVI